MYLKASGLGLQADTDPAAIEPIVSGPLNDQTENRFFFGTRQCQ